MKRRILSWLLVLAMVLSMVPGMVFAEDAAATWTKTPFEDIQATDTVAITMTKEGVTYALPTGNLGGSGQPLADTATISGTTLTTNGDTAAYGWSIVPTEGGYYIKTGESYLYITATNNGVKIGETATVWTLIPDNYLSADDGGGTTRYLGVYVGNTPDWRCYKTYATGNISGETLEFWVLGGEVKPTEPTETEPTQPTETEPTQPTETEPTQPTEPKDGEFADLVTELENGGKVYIYNPKNKAVLTSTVSGTQLASVTGSVENDQLEITEEMEELTVVIDADGYYSFLNEAGQYLTFGGSANNLTFEDAESDGSLWTVEAGEGGFFVKAVSNNTMALEYYKGNYTVYSFQSYNPGAYLMQFFAGAAGGFTDTIATGDQVIIYNPTYSMALGTGILDTAKNQDLAGTELVLSNDGKLSGYTDENVWTVTANEDGTYSFTSKDGQKLAVVNRTHLGFADEATNWTLTKIEGKDDEFFVGSGQGTYLEWYADKNYWSAYYNPSEAMYAIRFYLVSGTVTPSNVVATPKASVKSGTIDAGTVVELTCATEGATILYKIGDGEWQTYTEALTINEDTVLTVKAVLEGKEDSKEVTFKYTIYVPPVMGDKQARLVTDISQLNSGDQIIIVTKDYEFALGVTQKSNNRDYGLVIKSYDRCSYDEGTQIVTLESGVTENTFALYATNGDFPGYLYASEESGNLLRTQDTKDVNASWTITISANGEAAITSLNEKKSNTIRYNTTGIFSCYGATGQKPVCIYKLDGQEKPGLPEEGATVVLYNYGAKGVLSKEVGSVLTGTNKGLARASATIAEGKAVCANGAFIYTVEKNGDYYRFYNESYGYVSTTYDVPPQLFYIGANNGEPQPELVRNSDWTAEEYNGGYRMVQEYEGTTYVMCYDEGYFIAKAVADVQDRDAVTFQFYPCGNEKITEGVINEPYAVFGNPSPAYAGRDYILQFTVDTVFGVKELKAYLGETELTCKTANESYSVVIPAAMIVGDSLTVTVKGMDNKDVEILSEITIEIKDDPMISDVTPIANTETKENKRPEISAKLSNVGENPVIVMTINGQEVEATYADGVVSYTPAEDMADGRVTVVVTVTREDGKTAKKTWAFNIGEAEYILMYGQLHSHNGEYSDGSGTLAGALEYIESLPEEANVDFVALTDHSNYFDSTDAANPEAALFNKDLCTDASWKMWNTYKTTMAEFNKTHDNVIAIAGFEMTWSGGPGHMNTFVTEGIVSRNNKTLNNKSSDAGMRAYYDLLSTDEGVNSITQLNHPGSTFGNFSDFAYWNETVDTRVYLVEVGNGEGPVNGSGYYPSYEQYILALDKGWHIAPTNNQDNHKGKWGNGNEARDVVLAEEFSEEAIYEAIRNYRVYATEDRNLEISYKVNDLTMGTIIETVPQTLKFDIVLRDPDATDKIVKAELVVNSGKVAYTWDNAEELASGILSVELEPEYSYYFLRVTEADKDIAVTAPVWVGESLKVGLRETTADITEPKVGEEVTLSTTLYNEEASDAIIKSVVYTLNGSQVLFADTNARALSAASTETLVWKYVPTEAKVITITVTVIMEYEGKDYTYTANVELNVATDGEVTDIAEVRKVTEEGYKFNIEGVVTSNASGYDKETAFFDCIYVQDETAGINCFPIAGDYRIGDMLRISGSIDFYQGEPELQVQTVEKLGETDPVAPQEITSAQLNDRSVEGSLVTLKGTVTEIVIANGLVESIYLKDANGVIGRVFIDGYITATKTIENLEVGAIVAATGIASYDDTYAISHDSYARIRVRDRADVTVQPCEHDFGEGVITEEPTCVEVGVKTYTCAICGATKLESIPATGEHTYENGKCTVCGDEEIVPTEEPTEPSEEPTEPSEEPTEPSEEPTEPSEEPTEPSEEPTEPSEEPTEPSEEPTEPSEEPTEPFVNPYTDVDEDAWYYSYVMEATQKGLVNGVKADLFKPEANLTRAQFATILYRSLGAPSVEGMENPYTDLTDDWYKNAVIYMSSIGVINGVGKGRFAPESNITREQMVTMLYRLAKAEMTDEDLKVLDTYEDRDAISGYAEAPMAWAIKNGLVNGVGKNKLAPQGLATRAQAAKVVSLFAALAK